MQWIKNVIHFFKFCTYFCVFKHCVCWGAASLCSNVFQHTQGLTTQKYKENYKNCETLESLKYIKCSSKLYILLFTAMKMKNKEKMIQGHNQVVPQQCGFQMVGRSFFFLFLNSTSPLRLLLTRVLTEFLLKI